MSESLWVIPDALAVKTPLSILREQANLLTQQTKAVLEGEVSTRPAGSNIELALRIKVPALENYTVTVLTYSQPVTIYPGLLSSLARVASLVEVGNQAEFVKYVTTILSSEQVQNVLAALLSQATEI
jgi:hypothetical protein